MSSKNHFFIIFLIIIFIMVGFFTHASRIQENNPSPLIIHPTISLQSTLGLELPNTTPFSSSSNLSTTLPGPTIPGGLWILLQKSIGVSAMHMQLLYNNKVVIFDRTDFGRSNLSLPFGKCRFNDEKVPVDCSAHSLIYDIATNTFRPLMVQTDVWCSSAAVNPDGVLVQTGGYRGGADKIRLFTPCNDDLCDWVELPQNLTVRRWYASDHILPDGRIIIVGGRRSFSYEFFPKNALFSNNAEVYWFQFLKETSDPREENNLYPFLHLLPDGNLFVFANQRSVLLDYVNNKILREYPVIPGEKRSYPSTGSSALLPLQLGGIGSESVSPEVEVMICGGANGGAYLQARSLGIYAAASKSCGRLRVTDPDPKWVMEEMPMNRVMPDMLLLPTGDVIIVNGASRGAAGWELADDPVLNPVLYRPEEIDPNLRFAVLNPTVTPRLYHSSAILLPDGRILVGGSNPHVLYRFTGVKYPTDLSLEAFLPPYLDPQYSQSRPSILSLEGPTADNLISYGQQFSITFTLDLYYPDQDLRVTMIAPSFTTHSFAMNQRLMVLDIVGTQQLSAFSFKVTVYAPPTQNIAPPGYYMVFVVNEGIPSVGIWIRMK